jgi:hypothetical protein
MLHRALVLVAALALSPTLHAQMEAGSHRPATIPSGYVVTPFGYFHPLCVQSIAEGERLMPDGQIQRSDGSAAARVSCSHPQYAPNGTPRAAAQKRGGPDINGWLENANYIAPANQSFSALYASTTVPAPPKVNDGQVLYFFPGLEDIDNVISILQPVLTWYQGEWTISNWNCCLNGTTVQSTPVVVNPGDLIVSSITQNCPPGKLYCSTWNIFSLDLRNGKSTTLAKTPSDGQIFNWAFGAALEPYYVVSCDDFPKGGHETFQVIVFDRSFRPIDPQWSGGANNTETPQCGFNVSARPFEVTLDY